MKLTKKEVAALSRMQAKIDVMKTAVAERAYCEVTHETAAGTMTCSWIDGRVKLVEHFALAKTYVLIDEQVKATYDNLTIDEFIRLQYECQRVADGMKGGAL